MSKAHLQIEYDNLISDMGNISPKLALYKELKAKAKKILDRINA